MGEYAMYAGQRIKIGTCEDMYYLRWDQRHIISPEEGQVDPTNPSHLASIRFRFPWPDEDGRAPGDFENYGRAVAVDGLKVPAEVEHHQVQFRAEPGYLLSLPCPEGPQKSPAPVIHKNGWRGDVLLVQQALRAEKLVSIFQCGGCNAKFRIEDVSQLTEMLEALRERAKKEGAEWYKRIADRIEIGYYYDQLDKVPQNLLSQ